MLSGFSRASGFDVAIVGGGVMGCGLAWRLSVQGLRVAIVERTAPAAEASSAAAGILAAQIESPGPGPLLDLALASRALYPRWRDALFEETGQDIGYQPCGALLVVGVGASEGEAQIAAALTAIESRRQWQAERNLRVELVDGQALRTLEPALAGGVAALRSPDDGQVDPVRLCQALLEAATRRGARIIHATVERILTKSGRATGLALSSDDGSAAQQIDADRVVICAGSWSTRLPGSPLPADAVEPVRGQMLELGAAPKLLRHVVFGQVAPAEGRTRSLHGYLVPRSDGRVLIGSTMERVGFVKQVTPRGLLDLLTLGSTLAPALQDAPVLRTWSGLRPGTADELPLLGPTSVDGLLFCTGHFRNGILLAPISAEAISQLVSGVADSLVRSTLDQVNWASFLPSRLDNKAA